ncbi:MAG: MerC domain-containing protein [Bacteroidota bacterium]
MSNFLSPSLNINRSSDSWGAIASAICLVHCLLTPFLFITHAHAHAHGHVEGHHEAGPFWWGMIDYLFLAISFIAVHYSAKKTSLKWMPFAMYGSWGLLALYIVCEKYHLVHLEHELIFVPALSLVGLHLYNRHHCRCEAEACKVPESLG